MICIRTIFITIFCLISTNLLADPVFDKAPKIAADSAINVQSGGLQFIFNKSDKTVVIELGDFFPTPYKLDPGQSTIAVVSSDRQSITIRSAY